MLDFAVKRMPTSMYLYRTTCLPAAQPTSPEHCKDTVATSSSR